MVRLWHCFTNTKKGLPSGNRSWLKSPDCWCDFPFKSSIYYGIFQLRHRRVYQAASGQNWDEKPSARLWMNNSWIVGIPSCNRTQKANWKPWPIWKLLWKSIAKCTKNPIRSGCFQKNDFFPSGHQTWLESPPFLSWFPTCHGSHGGSHEIHGAGTPWIWRFHQQ